MRVWQGVATAVLLVFSLGQQMAIAAPSGGGGGGTGAAPVDSRPKSPEQQAEAAYLAGIKHKERAWKAEEKAQAATSDKKRAKQEKRAAKSYKKAQDEFASVLQVFPEHYKAANELGYVLRKQGNFERAIGAYNYALKIHPDFLEAIEYRGEAFVALGYYDEAKAAYMRLFRDNGELADMLMTKMRSWAADQTEPSARARDFVEWIEERQNVSAFGELTESSASGW